MNPSRNRRIQRRIDPQSREAAEMKAASIKMQIFRAKTIIDTLKDNPGWLALVEDLNDQLAHVESQLDAYGNMTDKQRDFLLKERIDLKTFILSVEKREEELESMQGDLEKVMATINEYKSREAQV